MSKLKVDEYGTKRWLNEKGKYHRLDGPAYEGSSGYKSWWVNGRLHRLDGPAVERPDGYKEWWINHWCLLENEFENHPLVIFYRLSRERLS
jgi:hypothetical protein